MFGPVLTRLVAGKSRRNGKEHLKGQFSMSKLSNLTMLQVSCPRNGNGVIDFHFFPSLQTLLLRWDLIQDSVPFS